jgi:Tol biopolymer transport system component
MSDDGRYVAFNSGADNLVEGDTNKVQDVFVHDRLTGSTIRVSVAWTGAEANDFSEYPTLAGDGSCVTFESDATNLVPRDSNGQRDIFVYRL